MKTHEYQAKQIFKTYNIPIPKGRAVRTIDEALLAAVGIGSFPMVVKAQVHAGGRGLAGGIRVVNDAGELKEAASTLLGKKLITPQTGKEGKPVNDLLIEESLGFGREIYLGMIIDRSKACVTVLASPQGGMEIEKIAAASPERVFTETIDPAIGLRPFQTNRLFFQLEIASTLSRKLSSVITNIYRLFMEKDCSLAEINPLVITGSGELVALDAKINFDDNALYRHADISALRDFDQEDPLEVKASKYNLNYIKLRGNVGCMVNGAGLAMATMDLIKFAGAEPANFLDVGGGATAKMVTEGLKILLSDRDVRAIFINIFGGILRCDVLAKGVVDAARDLEIGLPVVIRLEGTNVSVGREILDRSGLRFIVASGLDDAARKVAEALKSGSEEGGKSGR
jgi:succinyl-CoA synthetase beta subunit